MKTYAITMETALENDVGVYDWTTTLVGRKIFSTVEAAEKEIKEIFGDVEKTTVDDTVPMCVATYRDDTGEWINIIECDLI